MVWGFKSEHHAKEEIKNEEMRSLSEASSTNLDENFLLLTCDFLAQAL